MNYEAIVNRKGVPDEMDTPTLAAATNASFHSPFASVALAHSLSSAVEVSVSLCLVEFVTISPSLSGAERYRWVQSMWKDEGKINWLHIHLPETHSMRDPLI